jgi:hypothetical protein
MSNDVKLEPFKKRFHVEGQTSTQGPRWQIWDGERHCARFKNIADRTDADNLCEALNARHQPQREAVLEDCDIAWLWKVHTDAQSKGLHADQRKIERILAALKTTPSPARPILLEMAEASDEHKKWERRWRALGQMYAREKPCFVDSDGDWCLRDFLDYAGAICGFGGDILGSATPAPAVSRDDQALLADICDNMAEVLKPLPGIPDAPGQHAGTRATESGDGDEA